jgi:hypothetical protein
VRSDENAEMVAFTRKTQMSKKLKIPKFIFSNFLEYERKKFKFQLESFLVVADLDDWRRKESKNSKIKSKISCQSPNKQNLKSQSEQLTII